MKKVTWKKSGKIIKWKKKLHEKSSKYVLQHAKKSQEKKCWNEDVIRVITIQRRFATGFHPLICMHYVLSMFTGRRPCDCCAHGWGIRRPQPSLGASLAYAGDTTSSPSTASPISELSSKAGLPYACITGYATTLFFFFIFIFQFWFQFCSFMTIMFSPSVDGTNNYVTRSQIWLEEGENKLAAHRY